jgi:hypothetical protein
MAHRARNLAIALALLGLGATGGFTLAEMRPSAAEISMGEDGFVEYRAFLERLDAEYPYYRPDGITYKSTLGDLLERKQTEAEETYARLQDKLNEPTEIELANGEIVVGAPTTHVAAESLRDLHAVWRGYTEAACDLREQVWQGGSGSSVAALQCQLYETEKYLALMRQYED